MGWGNYGGYGEYETVASKKAKAAKRRKALMKKDPSIEPVIIEGTKISKSWWGIAWNKNLESYSDFSNRIGRGRAYLKHGSVLDLRIQEGEVISQVSGSGTKPYKCNIEITHLKKSVWACVKELSDNKFESLSKLLQGTFPKELQQIFSSKGEGLFPSPTEIKFSCSCPDSARMCKHIAATLYGVGNRLDYHPELLFKLRGVDVKELVEFAMESQKFRIIEKAKCVKSKKIMNIEEDQMSELFGINFKD